MFKISINTLLISLILCLGIIIISKYLSLQMDYNTFHQQKQEEYCIKVSHGNTTEYTMCKADFYKYLDLNILRRELYIKEQKECKKEPIL